jgi:galactokinase/mevalonate kinase-like predicted kinase
MTLFDFCLITAPSEKQAADFRRLIARRVQHELYPREVDFRVYADPPGRAGSGGGTLVALERLLEEEGAADARAFFSARRILIVHAGGESRRLPCFAPEGKLFCPLPAESSSILPPVALDLQLALYFKFPWRRGEVLIASGDVILDFDIAAVPAERGHLCGFAKAAPPEQGSRHGVFRLDPRRERVLDYLQKVPAERLRREALLEGTADCALDVGLVALSPEAAAAFVELGRLPSAGGTLREDVAAGRLRFDLYLEILTAGLPGLSFEAFRGRIAGASSLSEAHARALYDSFHRFPLEAVVTRSTTFVHFGTLRELASAARELVQRGLRPFYDEDPGELRPHVTEQRLEYDGAAIDGDRLMIGLDPGTPAAGLPAGLCLDVRELPAGTVHLVYGLDDSFRPQPNAEAVVFCGRPLAAWLAERGLRPDDVGAGGGPVDLLELRLFAPGMPAALVASYWTVPDSRWTEAFRRAPRLSLREANEADDVVARDERRSARRVQALRRAVLEQQGWRGASAADFKAAFTPADARGGLRAQYASTDDPLLRLYRRALLAQLLPEPELPPESEMAIEFVDRAALPPVLEPHLKLDQIVWARSPVRLDLAGGWTDTPPYTLRYGGQVVNVAVDLNGQPPIQVFCRRTEEAHVRVHSVDLGVTETIRTAESLAAYRDPSSPFSLLKAALHLQGMREPALAGGSGLEITLLCAVPKGSGLGTSSILGATILAALQRFLGCPVPRDELFRQVLQLEQMLTTGGGWQDQIGGVAGGVKYIETRPGLKPAPILYQLDPWIFEDRHASRCFTLFYTGLTRLAKNILVDVVTRVNGNSKSYLFTLRYMRQLAASARDAIALRSLPGVAEVLSQSWEANKRIHASTTNEEVEAMLLATRPHYSGVKLLGAGGGGYALFLSPDVASAERLREVLAGRFEDERARLVDFALNPAGLSVSVS